MRIATAAHAHLQTTLHFINDQLQGAKWMFWSLIPDH